MMIDLLKRVYGANVAIASGYLGKAIDELRVEYPSPLITLPNQVGKKIIKDGNIYARGAIDDKGPTMAAYYAMKIVKELGLPINKRVRMILGTDEESQWRCVLRSPAHSAGA